MKKTLLVSIGITSVMASLLTLGVNAQKPPSAPPTLPDPGGMMQMMKAHQNAFKLVGLLFQVRAIEAGKNSLSPAQARSILAVATAAQAKKQLDEATAGKAIKSIQSTLTDKQRKEIAAMNAGMRMPPSGGGSGMMMPPGGPGGGQNGRRVGPGGPLPGGPGGAQKGFGMGKRGAQGGGVMMPPGGPTGPGGPGGRRMGQGGPQGMPDMANFNPLKPRPAGPGGKLMSPIDDLVKVLKLKAKGK